MRLVSEKLLKILALCFVISLFTLPARASVLGLAGDYNIFVFNDLYGLNSDSEGSVAAGGNVDLSGYYISSTISGGTLVTGGNLSFINGQVGSGGSGSAYVGGTSTLTGTNIANIYSNPASQVDFAAEQAYLEGLSTNWSGLAANGAATYYTWGTYQLTGTDSNLNVFNLDGSQLSSTNYLEVNAPAGSTVLLNISGVSSGFTFAGMTVNGVTSDSILFNFYEAEDVFFNGVGVYGSVLAPFANVDGVNGQINGNIIANSMSQTNFSQSTIELHNVTFDGDIPTSTVPLPASAFMLAPALLGLVGFRRYKR